MNQRERAKSYHLKGEMSDNDFLSSGGPVGQPGATPWAWPPSMASPGPTGANGGTVLATGDALAHHSRVGDGCHVTIAPHESQVGCAGDRRARTARVWNALEYVEGSIGGAALASR